jgi:hypothetical protein
LIGEGLSSELSPGAGFPDASLLIKDPDDGPERILINAIRVCGQFQRIREGEKVSSEGAELTGCGMIEFGEKASQLVAGSTMEG